VAEKRTTPACARQAVTQGNSAARKKATQGGVSRKGSQSSPRRSGKSFFIQLFFLRGQQCGE